MSLTTLPTKTDLSIGRVKTDRSPEGAPAVNLSHDVPAPEWERVKDAIVANASTIGLGDGSTSGSLEQRLQTVETGGATIDWKGSVRVAATVNLVLNGVQTIDGVLTVAGNRVLAKDQASPAENGIYVVAAGAWSRSVDADTDAEVTAGMAFFIEEGTVSADFGYVLTTNDPITVGVTALSFVQFNPSGTSTRQNAYQGGAAVTVTAANGSPTNSNAADTTDLLTLARTFAGAGGSIAISHSAATTGKPVTIQENGAGSAFGLELTEVGKDNVTRVGVRGIEFLGTDNDLRFLGLVNAGISKKGRGFVFTGAPGSIGDGAFAGGAGGAISITAGAGGPDGGAGGGTGADLSINPGAGGGAAADGNLIIGSVNTTAIKVGNGTGNPSVTFLGTGLVDAANGTLDVPSGTSFKIGGVALTAAGFTAANVDDLLDGSDADALHTHATLLNTREIFFPADVATDLGDYRVRNVGGNGTHRFNFKAPHDFTTITALVLVGAPSAGAAGASKDIDLSSDYGGIGELTNVHSESDTATVYDLTGTSGEWTEIDISGVFSSLAAGDFCGLQVNHMGIGGAIDYIGIRLRYT